MEGLGELSDGSRSGIGIGGRMQPMSRIQMDGIEAANGGDDNSVLTLFYRAKVS